MEETDAQLQIRKRSRRRLVGAVAFVALVAVILPMVMDQEPSPVVQDVEIRIPGQDERPFTPRFATTSEEPVEPAAPAAPPSSPPPVVPAGPASSPAMAPNRAPEKPVKPEKPAAPDAATESRRAAAILAGKTLPETPAAKAGEHVLLIGAFASEANVRNIRNKLGELGIRTYTEPLESPQGRKTRVRAGPFPSREAAEKALEKMKRIGVSAVVSARP